MPVYELRDGAKICAHVQAAGDTEALALVGALKWLKPEHCLWLGDRRVTAISEPQPDDDPVAMAERMLGMKHRA
jgi:hypothetical protein